MNRDHTFFILVFHDVIGIDASLRMAASLKRINRVKDGVTCFKNCYTIAQISYMIHMSACR
jgi:hypothetical protein